MSDWRGLILQVTKDNGVWVMAVIVILGVAATFWYAGWQGALVALFAALVIIIAALARTLRNERNGRATAEGKLAKLETAVGAPAEEKPASSPSLSESREALTATPSAAEVTPPTASVTTAPSERDVLKEAEEAAASRDVSGVHRLLDGWVNDVDSRDDRIDRRLARLSLLFEAGDQTVIDDYRALADEFPTLAKPVAALARVFENLGETRAAAEEVDRRKDQVVEERPSLLLYEAQLRRAVGQSDVALRIADSVLQSGPSPNVQARALGEKGYALKALGRREESFAALERAVEIDPAKVELRFNLGLDYLTAGVYELAVQHFGALSQAQKNDRASLNNLGVALDNVGLAFMSVTRYREAAEAGASLAASNIAKKALAVGLAAEARDWITKGREKDDPDRLSEPAAELLQKERGEEDRLKEILERAQQLGQVVEEFSTPSDADLPAGRWQFSTGEVVEFHVTGLVSTGTAGQAQSLVTVTFAPAGSLLKVTYALGQYTVNRAEGTAVKHGPRIRGYLTNMPVRGQTALIDARVVG
jgi:tetratricopeptide (TPR) repeat protein